ncbi:MAG: hypothetical protein R3C68_17605 [Myxococcota bacterium]
MGLTSEQAVVYATFIAAIFIDKARTKSKAIKQSLFGLHPKGAVAASPPRAS